MVNEKRIPFYLFILAILIRIGYAWLNYDHLVEGDAYGYVYTANEMLSGEDFIPFWPPGLPLLLVPGMAFLGDQVWVHMLGMLVIFSLGARLFYRGLRKYLKPKHTNLILAIFAIYPAFIHHAVSPLTHLPVAVCLLGLFLALIEKKPLWQVGIWLGIAVMIRPATIVLVPVILFVIWKHNRPLKTWPVSLLPLFILLTVWQSWTYSMSGHWVWINEANNMNVFLGNNPDTPLYRTWWLGSHQEEGNRDFATYTQIRKEINKIPLSEQGSAYMHEAINHVWDRPDLFVIRTLNRIRCFFAFDTFAGAGLIDRLPLLGILFLALDAICYIGLGLMIIFAVFYRAENKTSFIMLMGGWLILAYALPYFFTISHPTYHLPIVPLVVFVWTPSLPGFHLKEYFLSRWGYAVIAFFLFIQVEWIFMMAERW